MVSPTLLRSLEPPYSQQTCLCIEGVGSAATTRIPWTFLTSRRLRASMGRNQAENPESHTACPLMGVAPVDRDLVAPHRTRSYRNNFWVSADTHS